MLPSFSFPPSLLSPAFCVLSLNCTVEIIPPAESPLLSSHGASESGGTEPSSSPHSAEVTGNLSLL